MSEDATRHLDMNKGLHRSVSSITLLIISLLLVNCTYAIKTGDPALSCTQDQIAKYDEKSDTWRCTADNQEGGESGPQFVVKDGNGKTIGVAIQNRNMNRVVSVVREQAGLRLLLRVTAVDIGFEDSPPRTLVYHGRL